MKTIDWLSYDTLFAVITTHGFTSTPLPEGGYVFTHPSSARIIIPVSDRTQPVHNLHYGATVTVLTNYGIMTREAVDLALLQAAHPGRLAQTSSPAPV